MRHIAVCHSLVGCSFGNAISKCVGGAKESNMKLNLLQYKVGENECAQHCVSLYCVNICTDSDSKLIWTHAVNGMATYTG